MPKAEITGFMILNAITRVLQSYQEISLTDVIQISCILIKLSSAGGKDIMYEADHNKYLNFYSSFSRGHIKQMHESDDDFLCLPKSILMGYSCQANPKLYKRLLKSPELLRRMAKAAMRRAKLDHNGPCNMMDVRILQESVVCRLVIYDKELRNAIVYIGPPSKHPVVHLCLFDDHFSWIKSVKKYLKTNYYCLECNVSRFILTLQT